MNRDTRNKPTYKNYENKNQNNFQEKNRETNRELIKYIYSTLDISHFKFDVLKYEQQLSKFINDTYFVSPNYNGKNCFLVFTKIGPKYYSFMIDRRQLSYTFDKVKFDEVYVMHCNVDVDLSIYAGTILDGVYIKKDNTHEFIVTDVYTFKGSDYTNDKLDHKLFELQMYLDNINSQMRYMKEKINSKMNVELKVNKLYKLTDIRKFMNKDIKEYENKYLIRGVCFYPEISGTKLIHIFDNQDNDQQNMKQTNIVQKHVEHQNHTINKIEKDFNKNELQKSKNIVKKIYVANTSDPIYAILEMKSTNIPDIYKLFAVETVGTGSETRYKKCQMDIAYIPNIKISQWCRDITTKSHNGCVFVKCIWRDDKRKWEPIELKPDSKLPSLINDIRKHIVAMEQSDSDSDVE